MNANRGKRDKSTLYSILALLAAAAFIFVSSEWKSVYELEPSFVLATSATDKPYSNTPLLPLIGDFDGDGVPEIIVPKDNIVVTARVHTSSIDAEKTVHTFFTTDRVVYLGGEPNNTKATRFYAVALSEPKLITASSTGLDKESEEELEDAGRLWSSTLKVVLFDSLNKKAWENQIPIKVPFDATAATPEDDMDHTNGISHQDLSQKTEETDIRALGVVAGEMTPGVSIMKGDTSGAIFVSFALSHQPYESTVVYALSLGTGKVLWKYKGEDMDSSGLDEFGADADKSDDDDDVLQHSYKLNILSNINKNSHNFQQRNWRDFKYDILHSASLPHSYFIHDDPEEGALGAPQGTLPQLATARFKPPSNPKQVSSSTAPNVVLVRTPSGVHVVHLYTGLLLTRLFLIHNHAYVDIDGSGSIDSMWIDESTSTLYANVAFSANIESGRGMSPVFNVSLTSEKMSAANIMLWAFQTGGSWRLSAAEQSGINVGFAPPFMVHPAAREKVLGTQLISRQSSSWYKTLSALTHTARSTSLPKYAIITLDDAGTMTVLSHAGKILTRVHTDASIDWDPMERKRFLSTVVGMCINTKSGRCSKDTPDLFDSVIVSGQTKLAIFTNGNLVASAFLPAISDPTAKGPTPVVFISGDLNGDGVNDIVLCTPRYLSGYLLARTASQIKAAFAFVCIILLVVLLITTQRRRQMYR